MIDDLSRSIRAHLYERVTNPLLGAVTVAWLFWNYKLILVLASELSLDKKIAFIEVVLYGEWYWGVLYLVVFPLVSGMAFLYAYPIPATYVYRYTRNHLKELKKIKLQVEDETPVSQEEYVQLKRKVYELEARYYSDLTERDAEISRLKELLKKGSSDDGREPKIRSASPIANPGSQNEIDKKKELKRLAANGKISHRQITAVVIGGIKYSLGNEIKSGEPGEVTVLKLKEKYEYEQMIPVHIEISQPLEPDHVLWVFDGYSHRELSVLEFEIQKADFKSVNARIEIHQPNPIKPGKPVVVSNIVQFAY